MSASYSATLLEAAKWKPYFQEHPITVVCTAPLAEIIGSRDASGRVAKWAIELAPYTIYYQPRTAIKSQALADFLVDWAETQYQPPAPDSTHWQMHFDGSKMRTGLGAGIVLTSPKGDKLRYVLQIHFAASNNIAEFLGKPEPVNECLVFSDVVGGGKMDLQHISELVAFGRGEDDVGSQTGAHLRTIKVHSPMGGGWRWWQVLGLDPINEDVGQCL